MALKQPMILLQLTVKEAEWLYQLLEENSTWGDERGDPIRTIAAKLEADEGTDPIGI